MPRLWIDIVTTLFGKSGAASSADPGKQRKSARPPASEGRFHPKHGLAVTYALVFRQSGLRKEHALLWAAGGIFCTSSWFYGTSTFDDILAEMKPAAPRFLALDGDAAGEWSAATWPAWAIRVRPPESFKDRTEAAQAGVNLRRFWSDRLGSQ